MARPRRQPKLSIDALLNRYFGSMLTPKQQRVEARQQTNRAIQDSMRQLRTTYQRERERDLREQYAQGAYAGLLRGFGQEGTAEAQAIKDAYARAAGLSQAEAGGLISSTTGQQAANVAASQAAAENLAGYTGDVATATPGGAVPSTNKMVLDYLSSLPRGTFAAQAEARAKGLASAGAGAGSQFALREAQIGQDLRELRDKYMMGVQDIQAKRGSTFQEALGNLRESGRGDMATLINALYLQNTMGKTEAELTGQYQGQLTVEEKQRRAANRLAQKKLAADIAESNARLGISMTNAQTSRMQANIAQGRLEIARAGRADDMVKLEQNFRTNARKYAADLINVNPKTGLPRGKVPSRQALVNAIFRIYAAPLVGKYGLTHQQLAQWARQVVSTFPDSYWKKTDTGSSKSSGSQGGKKTVTPVE